MSLKISSSSRDVFTYEGSTASGGLSGGAGVTGRVAWDDTLAARADRVGAGSSRASGCETGAELVGLSSLTMACSMAGRTLQFLSCFLRSDLAAFGAFLWFCELVSDARCG